MFKKQGLLTLIAALMIGCLSVRSVQGEEIAECKNLQNQYKAISLEHQNLSEQQAIHQAAASVLGNKVEQVNHVIKQFKEERDRIQSMINKGTYAYYGMKAAALYAGVRGLSLLRLPAITYTTATTGAMPGEWTILGEAWASLASIQIPKFATGSLQASSKEALSELEQSIRDLESISNKFREKGLKHEAEAQRLYRTKISGLEQQAKNIENHLFEKCKETRLPAKKTIEYKAYAGTAKSKQSQGQTSLSFGSKFTVINVSGGCGQNDFAQCIIDAQGRLAAYYKDSCDQKGVTGPWVKEGSSRAQWKEFFCECQFSITK